jgi:hypothetical protein
MKEELNIAAILKGKPTETKLWSPMLGDCIYCYNNTYPEEIIIAFTDKNGEEKEWTYSYSGRTISAPDTADVCLFPSKQMRDWHKFAWKKGDILVSNDSDCHIIFEGFSKDDYTKFGGKHWAGVSIKRYISCLDAQDTQDYHIEDDKNAAKTYINTVEEQLGGKLNLETLEIEKQPEFKDGDIVCISGIGYLAYGIVKSINNSSKKLEYYVLNDMSTLKFEDWLSFEDKQIQPITETQQIILFEALAKKGKRWNAENKQIEDLFKKYEFKPMDWCLMKDSTKYWELCQFAYTKKVHGTTIYSAVGGLIYYKCIPYNEETKHLLGTTDEWKGGE